MFIYLFVYLLNRLFKNKWKHIQTIQYYDYSESTNLNV